MLQWAYAIDGHGNFRLYHDANDLPVAIAPCVGFVRSDDPLWQATMRFAFSLANPAYVEGRFGGLGSAHTPGVWPLGDVQEWVWASLSGDTRRAGSCLAKLVAIADADGLLPETYDPGRRALAVRGGGSRGQDRRSLLSPTVSSAETRRSPASQPMGEYLTERS